MKQKNFLKTFLFMLMTLSITYSLKAQTTLSKGDIAIVAYSTPDDSFAFVTFVELEAGTQIYFTDEEADGDFTIGLGEGHLLYTAPSVISAGTVITGNASATNFTVASSSWAPGNSGDGVIAYQGSSVGEVTTFLHAVGEDAGDIGTLPANTLATNEYVLFGNDDGNYTGTTSGTAADLFSAINNVANWTTGGSLSFSAPASFTVSSGSDPSIGFDSSTSSETETDATFSVNVPVTVSNYDGNQIDMSVAVTGGTAEVADYTLNTTSLSFTADGTQNVSIDIVPDTEDFDDETIILTLTETSIDTGLIISQSTHTITVTDDETAPSIGFDAAASSETETNVTFTSKVIPISVSNYSGTQIDVNVSVTGGTAEAEDYTFTSPTSLSFTADGTQNITVDINDDADSDDETIILTITETSSVTGLTISEDTHTITITDNEGPSSIYSEDFTGQNDKGAVGPTPTIDVTGVDWTVDVSGASLSASSDFFRVVNEIFQGQDLDGDAIWMSPSIDISSFTNVQFSLSAVESGTMEVADLFVTEYRINGGTWTQAATNGSLNDDFTSETVSQTGLNGSTLEIRVTMNNGAGSEIHKLDDILVEGTPASSDPTVTFDAASSSETETDATFATSGIPIILTNYDADVTVTATVNGSSTAEAGDYVIDLTPLVFDANETLSIPLSINPDADFNDETIIIDITVTSGTADVNVSQHTVTITDDDIPNIYISEIMYNTPSTDDEWVELYNGSGSDIDVSNWTLEYTEGTFTFPSSTTFTNGAYIVIAVGSNGDGSFNNDNPFTPDYTSIASGIVADVATTNTSNQMRNDTDSVTLKNAGGSTVDIVTYNDDDGSSTDSLGDTFELVDTSVDNSATSSNWQVSGFSGGTPKAVNASYWTGTTDSDWNTASNWTAVGIPGTTSNVVIPNGLTNYPTASSAVTINQGIIESGATLIAQSTFTGNVTYNRSIPTGGTSPPDFYLISSPVVGQDIDAFVSAEGLATGTGDNVGLGDYNNSTTGWTHYQSGASGTGDFVSGDGRAIALAASGDIAFTGTVDVTDTGVDIGLTSNSNGFNLIGNPYPSYINANSNADGTNNLLSINSGDLTELTIWFWDETTDSYDLINQASSAFHIAPAQGFFVSSSGSNTFEFEENMQSHQSSDTFQRTSNNRPEINLVMSDGITNKDVDIFYIDGTTTGFDNGYDSSIFSGVGNSFAIYTHAVANGNGRNLGIQSLPNSDHENMVIPIGLIADAGKEITFTAEALNLPSGLKVFLEDRLTNTFTRLDEANSAYTIALTEKLDGVGRFYLHTKASALNIDEVQMENISMYTSNASTLKIVGLPQGKASITLFNILGKQVLQTSFTSNGAKDITLPNVSAGIYIVQLKTATGQLNQKITLD